MVFLYNEWTKATFSQLWRPTVVFVADQTRSYATEEAAKSFADIAFTYLTGRGWNVATAATHAPKVIHWGLIVLDAFWPAEIGKEPTPAEMEQMIKSLEEQRRKEASPQTIKQPPGQLPDTFRNPSSIAPPVNVSTEEERRRVIFSDPHLTREQAGAQLVKAASIVHGPLGGRFLDSFLWLYDIDRIEKEGLSEEAQQLFHDIAEKAKSLQDAREKMRYPNACLIAPPDWNGTPVRWTCSLPATQNYVACYCPPPPERVGQWISGFPTRLGTGQVCVVPRLGVCPLKGSAPLAGFCQCPEFPGATGQVRQ